MNLATTDSTPSPRRAGPAQPWNPSKQAGQITLATVLTTTKGKSAQTQPLSLSNGWLPIVPGESTDSPLAQYRNPDVIEAVPYSGSGAKGVFHVDVNAMNREAPAGTFNEPGFFGFQPLPVEELEPGKPKLMRELYALDRARQSINQRRFLGRRIDRPKDLVVVVAMLRRSLENGGINISEDLDHRLDTSMDPFSLLLLSYPFLAHKLFSAYPNLHVINAQARLQWRKSEPPRLSDVTYIRYDPTRVEMLGLQRDAYMQPIPIVP